VATLCSANYYSREMNRQYFSVSQWKNFERCEAATMAELNGEYTREETTALKVGSYVDAYFEGTLQEFTDWHPEIFNKRTGELKADYQHADKMVGRILQSPLMCEFLRGDKQTIMTAELFGYPWKIKMDVYNGERIVDLKTVRDFKPLYDPLYGAKRGWIEYWGYDLQGAIYQKVEQLATGRAEPLPFYIAAVTKEAVPDIALIQIPQYILDAAIKAHGVEALIDRYALIKSGDVKPGRCEECDWCKMTKVITEPAVYEMEEE